VNRVIHRKTGQPLLPILGEAIVQRRRFLIGAVLTIALTAPFGLWWVWPVLWLAPQATWLPLVTRLRNIAEHACVAKDEPDPLRHARTTKAGFLARLLLAPYYVNYHCEHHMFMHLPCYSLPRAHLILARTGVTEKMLTAPSYLNVLRLASSK
jgi:fatty acid desaturase